MIIVYKNIEKKLTFKLAAQVLCCVKKKCCYKTIINKIQANQVKLSTHHKKR